MEEYKVTKKALIIDNITVLIGAIIIVVAEFPITTFIQVKYKNKKSYWLDSKKVKEALSKCKKIN